MYILLIPAEEFRKKEVCMKEKGADADADKSYQNERCSRLGKTPKID